MKACARMKRTGVPSGVPLAIDEHSRLRVGQPPPAVEQPSPRPAQPQRQREPRCPFCKKLFLNREAVEAHCFAKHAVFECGACDATFGSVGRLREHERVHSGARPYRCSSCCDRRFRTIHQLNRHLAQAGASVDRDASDSEPSFTLDMTVEQLTGEEAFVSDMPGKPQTPDRPPDEKPVRDFDPSIRQHPLSRPLVSQMPSVSCLKLQKLSVDECLGLGGPPAPHYALDEPEQAIARAVAPSSNKQRAYFCWMCLRVFGSLAQRQVHVRAEHSAEAEPQQAVRCLFCSATFPYPSHLRVHLAQEHTMARKRPYRCETCSMAFALRGNLDKHQRRVHDHRHSRRLQCQLCPTGYDSQRQLTMHLERAHDFPSPLDGFTCKTCCVHFDRPRPYVHHVTSAHPGAEEFTCRRCKRLFLDASQFLGHGCIEPRPGAKADDAEEPEPNNPQFALQPRHPFKCPLCARLFAYPRAYRKHVLRHTRDGEDSLADPSGQGQGPVLDPEGHCVVCRQGFPSQAAFRRHEALHPPSPSRKRPDGPRSKFQCPTCALFFASHDHLAEHRAVAHLADPSGPVPGALGGPSEGAAPDVTLLDAFLDDDLFEDP